MAVPYTFADKTGNVPAEYLDANFTYLEAQFTAGGTVTAKTANYTVLASETNNTFTNAGAVGSVTLTLPTPASGLQYTFICAAAQTFTLDVGGSVQIAIGEIIGTAGGGATCNSPYSIVTLRAVSTVLWIATTNIGSWAPT